MIIDKITLHDFGIYSGINEIILTPVSKERPVTLFYGLNGAGKTTILEALQIILFGRTAKCLKDENYNDYILKRINKKSRYNQSSIKLIFRRTEQGQEIVYKIERIWTKSGQNVKEKLQVIRDGLRKKSLADHWEQSVNEILPSQISHFFFFDGEKIEDYASPEGGRDLISSGLQNLLGLDIIEQLQDDLKVIERRRQSNALPDNTQTEIKKLEDELSVAQDDLDRLLDEKTTLQTHKIDALERKLKALDDNFQRMGGRTAEQKQEIDEKLAATKERLNTLDSELINLASGALPLALVPDLLDDLAGFCQASEKANNTRRIGLIIEQRDTQILQQMDTIFEITRQDDLKMEKMKKYLFNDRKQRMKALSIKQPYPDGDELARLNIKSVHNQIKNDQSKIQPIIEQLDEAKDQQDATKTAQMNIVSDNNLFEVLGERDQIQDELKTANITLGALTSEIETAQRKVDKFKENLNLEWQKRVEIDITNKETLHYLKRLDDGRNILDKFQAEILSINIERIASLVLESYWTLLHKENLVKNIKINPETFDISLSNMDGQQLRTDQLSAGERQLLAISLLWGMARASAKASPVAVDTPLGRLDSKHRMRLVKQYFGQVSHQVLLFSTDEEIVDEYFDELNLASAVYIILITMIKTATLQSWSLPYDRNLKNTPFSKSKRST